MEFLNDFKWPTVVSIMLAMALTVSIKADDTDTERYLCIAEQATGFKFDKSTNRWRSTDFQVEHKFIISSDDSDLYTIHEFRTKILTFPCEVYKNGFLTCRISGGQVRFNKKTMRFIHTMVNGYVGAGLEIIEGFIMTEGADTPGIQIGTCSKF